jgi:hypothetical protein
MSTHYTHYLGTPYSIFQCRERGNNSSLDCHHFRLELRTWVAPTFPKLCMGCSSTTHMMGGSWFKKCQVHAIWSIALQGWLFGV